MTTTTKPELSREEWRAKTLVARRAARFRFAADRIKKILAGDPELTGEQRATLAAILHPGEDASDGAA